MHCLQPKRCMTSYCSIWQWQCWDMGDRMQSIEGPADAGCGCTMASSSKFADALLIHWKTVLS